MNDIETRLAAARARLILDQPFLGALVLRLPLKAATWCRTTATDAKVLYYNPQWIASLSPSQLQFALAHEALHCALGHFARRGHRIQRKWDLACDFAVNPLLVDEGLTPPAEALVLDVFRGMAAEEIYPCIDDSHDDSQIMDEHVWEGAEGGSGGQGEQDEVPGKGGLLPEEIDPEAGGSNPQRLGAGAPASGAEDSPPPLSAQERDTLQQQWQRHLAAAAQRAREAGKLSGRLARLVETALAAQVSWRALLANYLSQVARDDYTWLRPSRREGEVIWPSLKSRAGDIHVALDISGSISAKELAEFLGELNALKGTLPVRITLHACDSVLAEGGPWIYEPWETLDLPHHFAGGGGTSFVPVFEWLERAGARPDALIYFTDAEGEFPRRAPDYPVLWLIKGKAAVPWGRRIQLN